VYRAIQCKYVEGFVTLCIWLHTACMWLCKSQYVQGYILHVCGDVSYSEYRATYCMYVVMLVTIGIGLHFACMW